MHEGINDILLLIGLVFSHRFGIGWGRKDESSNTQSPLT